ncbi:MAG: ATP-binding protein, partial [Chloroflexi bacterium]|nr:ATP-binding protein [Chloroflexota bacterium]
SLLAEMFMTGIIDRAGNIDMTLSSPRIREGSHGPEYVVAWENETEFMRDIVISHVDIDNLIRAKAAIYAGFTVLSQSVGIPLQDTEQIIIGGSFGKYINIEKAIQIGLLPDLPWEKFKFLGNTSILGTYYAILNKDARSRIDDIASRMTYIELSADNSFYNAFMSALFLPHTDINNFPSVEAALALINPPNKQSA